MEERLYFNWATFNCTYIAVNKRVKLSAKIFPCPTVAQLPLLYFASSLTEDASDLVSGKLFIKG
jgi:hypothetical protein